MLPLPYSRFGVRQEKSLFWPQQTGADVHCRAPESSFRQLGRKSLYRRCATNQVSGAGVSGKQSCWEGQTLFGYLPLKATPVKAGKKLRCWNYEGDAGELPPTDWAALVPLKQALQLQEKEETRLFFCGPPTGDLAEIEAFCRLYRHAEHLHSTVMNALRRHSMIDSIDNQTLGPKRGDISSAEEKVASGLAHLMALLHEGKSNVLGVRANFRGKLIGEASLDERPPFARFREEVRECCKILEDALESLLPAHSEQGLAMRKRMLKLKNACLDAGFPRPDGFPSHADIPNLAPVRLRPSKSARTLYKDEDVAFWRGGHITEEGLEWLVKKGFKMIVDLREGSAQPIAECVLPEAVATGKLKVARIPVERGSAPSKQEVEEFARLVADARNRPLYLHTRAGVGRASAMVSRWREFVLQGRLQVGRGTAEGIDETLTSEFELLNIEDVVRISQEDALALEIGSRETRSRHFTVRLSPDKTSDEGAINVNTGHMPASGAKEGASTDTLGATEDERMVPAITEGSIDQHLGYFDAIHNAFEAQRPVQNVLSRQAMAKFMNRKKVPACFFTKRKNRAVGNLLVSSNTEHVNADIAGPANRWGLASPGIPRADAPDAKIQETHKQQSGSSVGEIIDKNGTAWTHFLDGNFADCQAEVDRKLEHRQENLMGSMVGPTRGVNGNFFGVLGEQDIKDDGDEAVNVEGDMCASTTGVVRLQSRKKAEMFLVRTDGYSCTRERVKESTLAFTHPSTQQQMLMWKTAPRTVLLLKKLGSELMEETQEVASFLHHQEGMNVVVEPEVHDQLARLPGFGFVQTFYNQDTSELHERVDFVVCLGGDGVILHTSNLFRNAVPPVVSFNLGSLGFLTSHSFKDYTRDLQAIIHGHNEMMTGVYITLRMRLRCELYRNGRSIPGKIFDVLNEVVVDRGSNPYLCKIECYERNRLITKVQADGVIVATPTGSTAYSTAAGGSMVHPNVPCMLFTPICPHSLSFRPVILPDSALLELKVPRDARNNAWVSFDGKKRQQLSKGDSVRIWMSEHPLPTVNKSDQTDDWFQSLVRCLNWNERLEQRPLSSS